MQKNPLFNIEYGLYVITARLEDRDNGMVSNAVMQITDTPEKIAVALNKASYTHEIIKATRRMNLNCLSTDTPFWVFENFGFVSGRNVNKFEKIHPNHTASGLAILPQYINSYIELEVEQEIDFETHTMFICKKGESKTVSETPTMSYSYYHKNVKPKPQTDKKKGYVCKICGYVYEGNELPSDFICPICKHGAKDFETIS